MTAFERAAAGPLALAHGADEEAELLSRPVAASAGVGSSLRSPVVLFALDVAEGVRYVSHNALAMLGLLAVLGALFLMERADVRYSLEAQTLSWLMERASVRASAAAEADGEDSATLLAMAEPEAIQRATAANPAELNRQQAFVAYWISRRYNVAPEPISRLVQEAWAVGHRVGMEPTLVLAVMAIESGFNPFAQSHVGAQGLMQVMTRVHQDKYEIFGGQNAAFDPVTNLRVGVQVLKDCIRRAGSLEGGLKYYVGAANLVDDGGYAAKVLAEQTYLRQVANGVKLPVTVTLPQAVVQADVQPVAPASAAKAGSSAAGPAAVVLPLPAGAGASEPVVPMPTAPARRPEQVAMLGAAR